MISPVLGASTSLYDKRQEPAYAGLPLVRYPLAHDALDWRCKENCVVSAIIRRYYLCSSRAAFIAAVAEIPMDMKHHHYPVQRIFQKTRSALRSHSPLLFTDLPRHDSVVPDRAVTQQYTWDGILNELVRSDVFRTTPELRAELAALGYSG